MEQLLCFLAGLLGALVHSIISFISKREAYKKDKGMVLPLKAHIKSDWPGIMFAFILVLVWLLMYGEAVKMYPAIQDFIRGSFFMAGLAGDYVIQKGIVVFKKLISSLFDTWSKT